jgi:hypothetical protein
MPPLWRRQGRPSRGLWGQDAHLRKLDEGMLSKESAPHTNSNHLRCIRLGEVLRAVGPGALILAA